MIAALLYGAQCRGENVLDLPEFTDVNRLNLKLVHFVPFKLVLVRFRRLQVNHTCTKT